MKLKLLLLVLSLLVLIKLTVSAQGKIISGSEPVSKSFPAFSGKRAFDDIVYQMQLGPRIPNSLAHEKAVDWLMLELDKSGWEAQTQEISYNGQRIYNVIGSKGKGSTWLILGAHYDSRIFADRDNNTQKRHLPVPGANDGASGVALLLELARVLEKDLPYEIWMVFFDAEDNGGIPGWNWIMGSTVFCEHLRNLPDERIADAVIIVDMIGDKNLNIKHEMNSDPLLSQSIWEQAARLGYDDIFIDQPGYHILDDHIPFIQMGISSVDIIDFDYPHWHQTTDTVDKVSSDSLQIVGDVLLNWLRTYSERKAK